MLPSSTLCRAQEAFHRTRADSALLENVRTVADKAAKAWGEEALFAEQREQRQDRTRTVAAGRLETKREQDDQAHSEDPDLDFAEA